MSLQRTVADFVATLATGAQPDYAAGTLPPDRATTGSAVLNMARQVGSAVGVAVVVAILGSTSAPAVADYHHVWAAELATGLLACLAIVVMARDQAQRPLPTLAR